ncbi:MULTISPECIES: hypothetical protein [unclassified Pseudoalteromonas]
MKYAKVTVHKPYATVVAIVKNEILAQAASRELLEETGLALYPEEFLGF